MKMIRIKKYSFLFFVLFLLNCPKKTNQLKDEEIINKIDKEEESNEILEEKKDNEIEIKWKFKIEYNTIVLTSPAVDMKNGIIYYGTGNYNPELYYQEVGWPFYINAISTKGKFLWKREIDGLEQKSIGICSDGSVIIMTNILWFEHPQKQQGRIWKFSKDGKKLWEFYFPIEEVKQDRIYNYIWIASSAPAIGADDTVYVVIGNNNVVLGNIEIDKPLPLEDALVAISSDGKIKWKVKLESHIDGPCKIKCPTDPTPVIGKNGKIYIYDYNKIKAFNNEDGTLYREVGGDGGCLAGSKNGDIIALENGITVYTEDLNVKWTYKEIAPISGLVIAGPFGDVCPVVDSYGTVYVVSKTKISAIKDGELIWQHKLTPISFPDFCTPLITKDGFLISIYVDSQSSMRITSLSRKYEKYYKLPFYRPDTRCAQFIGKGLIVTEGGEGDSEENFTRYFYAFKIFTDDLDESTWASIHANRKNTRSMAEIKIK